MLKKTPQSLDGKREDKKTPRLIDPHAAFLTQNTASPFFAFSQTNAMITNLITSAQSYFEKSKAPAASQLESKTRTLETAQPLKTKKLHRLQADKCNPVPIYLLTDSTQQAVQNPDHLVKENDCFRDTSRTLIIIERISHQAILKAYTVDDIKIDEINASSFPTIESHPDLTDKSRLNWEILSNENKIISSDSSLISKNPVFSQKKIAISLLPQKEKLSKSLSAQNENSSKNKQIYLIQIRELNGSNNEINTEILKLISELLSITKNKKLLNPEFLFVQNDQSTLVEKLFLTISSLCLVRPAQKPKTLNDKDTFLRKNTLLFETLMLKDVTRGLKDRFGELKVQQIKNNVENAACTNSSLNNIFNADIINASLQLLKIVMLDKYLRYYYETIKDIIPFLKSSEEQFNQNTTRKVLADEYHDSFWMELEMLRLASNDLKLVDLGFYTSFFGNQVIDFSNQENQNRLSEFSRIIESVYIYSAKFAVGILHTSKESQLSNMIFIKNIASSMVKIIKLFNEIGLYPAAINNNNNIINNNSNIPQNLRTPNPAKTHHTHFAKPAPLVNKENPNKRKENPNINNDNHEEGIEEPGLKKIKMDAFLPPF